MTLVAHYIRENPWRIQHKLFVDEKLICDFQADQPDKGNALIWVQNAEAHFDDAAITGDDIPDKDLSLSVQPQAKLATTWVNVKELKIED